MTPSLAFTGERFLPSCAGEIAYEHWHRYAFARAFARGRRVLDLACGEGYGTALLARAGGRVLGVDLSQAAVAHAASTYHDLAQCSFLAAPCDRLPLADGSFDLIVSFETIEHVDAATQQRMIAEFARLLAPGGLLIISSPNRATYSDSTGYHNEFHVHELYRPELAALLTPFFPAQRWFGQKIQSFSALWAEDAPGNTFQALEISGETPRDYRGPEPLYFVLLLARSPADLPRELPELSLFLDEPESLHASHSGAQRELIELGERFSAERSRLEALVAAREGALADRDAALAHLESLKAQAEGVVVERDAQLAGANGHILHLEGLVAEREHLVEERDAQLAALQEVLREEQQAHAQLVVELRDSLQAKFELNETLQGIEAERAKLVREVNEQVQRLADREKEVGECYRRIADLQATVLYRQSFRWWLRLPLARMKMALRQT